LNPTPREHPFHAYPLRLAGRLLARGGLIRALSLAITSQDNNRKELSMDEKDILWNMYQQHYTHGLHHETLRAATTNLLLVVAAGAIAVITHGDKSLALSNLALAILLIPIGLLGVIFSAKYHERFDFHMERARKYRDALEKLVPASNIIALKEEADNKTKEKHRRLFNLRLYKFWMGLHSLVAALGLILTVTIIMLNWGQVNSFFHPAP
jgi:hypothetical protein